MYRNWFARFLKHLEHGCFLLWRCDRFLPKIVLPRFKDATFPKLDIKTHWTPPPWFFKDLNQKSEENSFCMEPILWVQLLKCPSFFIHQLLPQKKKTPRKFHTWFPTGRISDLLWYLLHGDGPWVISWKKWMTMAKPRETRSDGWRWVDERFSWTFSVERGDSIERKREQIENIEKNLTNQKKQMKNMIVIWAVSYIIQFFACVCVCFLVTFCNMPSTTAGRRTRSWA